MTLSQEQRQHAIELIESGEKLEAVRYFQQVLAIDAEHALTLTEKLEYEIEHSQPIENDLKKQFQPTRIHVGKLVGAIFMSIGIVLVSITAYLIYSNQKFEVRAQPVKGKVIDYRSHISSHDNGSTMLYSPVFSYEFNGKTFTYFSTTSSSDKDYTVGEVIEILVDPDDPENVLVNSFMEKWFLSVLLGCMGTAFTVMGYVAYRAMGNRK